MIAGPITDREYDPEKEKRLVRASKRKILEYLESESFLGTGKHHFLIFLTKIRILTGLKNTMKEKLLIQKKGSIAIFVFHFVYLWSIFYWEINYHNNVIMEVFSK